VVEGCCDSTGSVSGHSSGKDMSCEIVYMLFELESNRIPRLRPLLIGVTVVLSGKYKSS